jgi:hypothetical protein
MKNLAYYLDADGQGLLKLGIFNFLGCRDYVEICGSRIDASHQWFDHNVYDIDEVSNDKYVGWVVHCYDECGMVCSGHDYKFYMPLRMLDYKVKSFRHAKNLFNKYLKRKC